MIIWYAHIRKDRYHDHELNMIINFGLLDWIQVKYVYNQDIMMSNIENIKLLVS